MIEAQAWIVLALFGGTIFAMAFVTSLPRDSRGGYVSRRILRCACALVFAWLIAKELLSLWK